MRFISSHARSHAREARQRMQAGSPDQHRAQECTQGSCGACGARAVQAFRRTCAPPFERRPLVGDYWCLAVGRRHVEGRGRLLGGHPGGSSFVVGPSERAPRRHCGALLLRIRAKGNDHADTRHAILLVPHPQEVPYRHTSLLLYITHRHVALHVTSYRSQYLPDCSQRHPDATSPPSITTK